MGGQKKRKKKYEFLIKGLVDLKSTRLKKNKIIIEILFSWNQIGSVNFH